MQERCQNAFRALPRSPEARYQTPKCLARVLQWAGESCALSHPPWMESYSLKNSAVMFIWIHSSCQLLQLCFIFSYQLKFFSFGLITIKWLLTSYPWLFESQLDTTYYTDCCGAWEIWMLQQLQLSKENRAGASLLVRQTLTVKYCDCIKPAGFVLVNSVACKDFLLQSWNWSITFYLTVILNFP